MISKKKILIVDDSELNRSLLADMLSNDYEILEAENGLEAIRILHDHELEISLMLLDIVMPQMDGFEVLAVMNKKGWIKTIPVIMISAETGGAYIDKAYTLGAIDYISRPFDERTVQHRVTCNFMLSIRQQEMSEMLSSQIYKSEKNSSLLIEILSNIVEFRNGESGLHVLHVNIFTQMILETLVKHTDKYNLSAEDISIISTASALHDIGKISIPSEILNKPGRFTPEEFAIMKSHTVEGAKMIESIPFRQGEALVKISYQICRWHHERYDGRGYPDGLAGEDIPISAQVVALADVYDALTSVRCYKAAFSHEKAVEMIMNGECGQFNPLLLECLEEIAPRLKEELNVVSLSSHTEEKIQNTVKQVLKSDKADASTRSINLVERERQKFQYLSDLSREVIFEYTDYPEMLTLSEWGAQTLNLPLHIADPSKNERWGEIFNLSDFAKFVEQIRATTPESPIVSAKYLLTIDGQPKWSKITAKVLWGDSEKPVLEGAIGKIVDVNEEIETLEYLEQKADHDALTGLLNHDAARRIISERLEMGKDKRFVYVFFDLDNMKLANDRYGHAFGDEVLQEIARRMSSNIRSRDIAARMGGDEFILFMEYRANANSLIERIFKRISSPYKDFDMSISMGVVDVHDFDGDYDLLFRMADTATYRVKNNGKRNYCFYEESMGLKDKRGDE